MAIKENVLPLAQSSGSGTYIRTLSSGGESQRASFDVVKGAITADMDDAIEAEAEARESADTQLETELNSKVDKVTGKGLSTNDFTNALKTKLDGIEAGAEVNVQANWTEADSGSDAYIKNKPGVVTTSTDGFMSAADKVKLNGIEAGAEVNIIETVKVNGTALVPDANRAVNVPAPTVDSALSTTSTNPVQNKIITGAINDVQADVDQNAEDIADRGNWTVGSAEQIVSDEASATDTTPYTFRRSGGGLIPFNFTREELNKVVGGTVAWNQLVQEYFANSCTASESSGVITITPSGVSNRYRARVTGENGINVIKDHIYFQTVYIKSDGTNSVGYQNYGIEGTRKTTSNSWTRLVQISKASSSASVYFQLQSADGATAYDVKKDTYMVFDLTALFGNPAIADYLYGLSSADSVATWLDTYFPSMLSEAHSYDSGSLQSVCVGAHSTTGKNLFGGVYGTDNKYKLFIPKGTEFTVSCSSGSNATYIYFYDENLTRIDYFSLTQTADGRAYRTFTRTHDIYYFAFGNYDNGDEQIAFGSDYTYHPYQKHTYPLDSTKTLRGRFYLDSNNQLRADGDIYLPSGEIARTYGEYTFTGSETWTWFASSKFWYMPLTGVNTISEKIKTSNGIVVKSNSQNQIRVYVSDNPSISENTNMNTVFSNGTAIVYPLITPTTETADPYTAVQICDSDGTEEFVDALVEAGTRDVAIPAGHETVYFEDMAGKLADLPPIPSAPSANGTYTLQAVVSSGTVTYQWTS